MIGVKVLVRRPAKDYQALTMTYNNIVLLLYHVETYQLILDHRSYKYPIKYSDETVESES